MDNSNQQPAAPMAPQPQMPQQMPNNQYQMPPKKGLSKGALWGIIGGSIGALVLIIVIVLVVVLTAGPSKDDYFQALSTVRSDMDGSKLTDSLSSSSDADEIKETMNKAIKKIDGGFEKLKASKVMKDAEVKKLFEDYKSEYDKVKPTLQTLGDVVGMNKKFEEKCSYENTRINFLSHQGKSGSEVKQLIDSTMSSCYEVLDEMTKSNNKDVAAYGEQYKKYYEDRRDYYAARADKNYTVKYPQLPSVSSPATSISRQLSSSKLTSAESKFISILREKSQG